MIDLGFPETRRTVDSPRNINDLNMFPRLQHTSLAVARSVFDFLTRIPRQLSSAVRNRITFPFSFEASFGTIPPSLRLVPSSRAKFWHVKSCNTFFYS
ncbi:hypothetical protein CDL15_Pgr000056 [Punica granatum]|uniref:Uncharacterized protein n=1 Tax=Punica granatum TaxID=22663 RepID=A0A218VR46_PUNGR|nr:hypothetical protein CDL15_Pgr000056 [Punica granatum]